MAKPAKRSVNSTESISNDYTFVCEEAGAGARARKKATLESTSLTKPTVDRFEATTHKQSRGGTDIDHIVVHYTTSRNIEGSISHFKTGSPRTSAHYIVGRDGELVQMVKDSEASWHAGNRAMNLRSIGIEHVARLGDKITTEQAKTSAALIRWLMAEYGVAKSRVIPHVCVKPTSCCGDLFKDFGGMADGACSVQKPALHKWMTSVGM